MIGYSWFEAGGTLWRITQRVILPLSMPHIVKGMTRTKARDLLRNKGAWLIRWEKDFDAPSSSPWWYIIKDGSEDFATLPKKTRYMVRKAAQTFYAESCDRETIIQHGYRVYCEAYRRYQTFEPRYSESEFRQAVKSLPPESEFWVVRNRLNGEMVGFSENLVRDGACFYLTMWLQPEAMKAFVGYLLFHEMNRYYLNERAMCYVSDGARSISHQTNIHDFLQSKFGFRKAYARLCVVYSPMLSWFVLLSYPWRCVIDRVPVKLFRQVSILLEQERIRRACTKLAGENDDPGA